MSDRCTDKRMADLLHHYELDLLADDDRREFELHLYECEFCFAKVRHFDRTARLMRHDPEVREAIGRIAADTKESMGERKRSRRTAHSRTWPAIIPITVAAAAALLLFLLHPWHVEIQPTREAIAQENRLAIMYFDNLVDRSDSRQLGEVAAHLLITDLSESAYFQVVSGQRLYDILKLLGMEGQKQVDRDIAHRVAEEAGADMMILGSIVQVDPYFVLTAQLIEVSTGKVVAAQRVSGEPGEDIFAMVDRLTTEIKGDLSLPVAARREIDPRIAEVTTHSADAYRLYIEGLNNLRKYYTVEAVECFWQALQFDSTFAMAYYYLAELSKTSLIDKAMFYLDRASRRDQYYIRSRNAAYESNLTEAITELQELLRQYPDEKEAFFQLGRYLAYERKFDQAIQYLRDALAIDPLYESAYNYMAYMYQDMGEYEKAIEAINKYIALTPDEPNPYDTRGEIYLKNGRLEQAEESFRQALQIKPDFRNSRWNLAHIAFLTQKYAAAESLYQTSIADDDPVERMCGRMHMALIPLAQGKFNKSLQLLDEALAANRAEGLIGKYVDFCHFIKSRIYMERGECDRAIQEFETHISDFQASSPKNRIFDRNMFVQLLVESGDQTRAEQTAQMLKDSLVQTNLSMAAYWYAVGCIEMGRGNPDSSIVCFQKTLEGWTDYPVHFMLARAYFEAGRLAEAVDAFESLLHHYSEWRVFWCIWSAKTHYYLGLAYEQSHWYDQAVEQYETFLDIWKDADPGIAEVSDARQRLTRLRASG